MHRSNPSASVTDHLLFGEFNDVHSDRKLVHNYIVAIRMYLRIAL